MVRDPSIVSPSLGLAAVFIGDGERNAKRSKSPPMWSLCRVWSATSRGRPPEWGTRHYSTAVFSTSHMVPRGVAVGGGAGPAGAAPPISLALVWMVFCGILMYLSISDRIPPYPAISRHIPPYHAISRHITPYHAISRQPYPAVSFLPASRRAARRPLRAPPAERRQKKKLRRVVLEKGSVFEEGTRADTRGAS